MGVPLFTMEACGGSGGFLKLLGWRCERGTFKGIPEFSDCEGKYKMKPSSTLMKNGLLLLVIDMFLGNFSPKLKLIGSKTPSSQVFAKKKFVFFRKS